jgi:hypothetical protein
MILVRLVNYFNSQIRLIIGVFDHYYTTSRILLHRHSNATSLRAIACIYAAILVRV